MYKRQEEKLARKQQRKAEKVGLGKLILWNSSSCSVALSTLMLSYATFYCTDVLQLAPALVGTLFMVSKIFDSFTDIVAGFIVCLLYTSCAIRQNDSGGGITGNVGG